MCGQIMVVEFAAAPCHREFQKCGTGNGRQQLTGCSHPHPHNATNQNTNNQSSTSDTVFWVKSCHSIGSDGHEAAFHDRIRN